MNRNGHNTAQLFVGTEIEFTPAHGQKTLFVVGIQPKELIEVAMIAHKCTHIYFGANQSFPMLETNNAEWTVWENMIFPLLLGPPTDKRQYSLRSKLMTIPSELLVVLTQAETVTCGICPTWL